MSHSEYFHNSKDVKNYSKTQEVGGSITETEKLTGKNGVLSIEMPKEYFAEKKLDKINKPSLVNSLSIIFKNFQQVIKDKHIVKWSLWWSASLCGYLQVP